jgi:hypothetical protein
MTTPADPKPLSAQAELTPDAETLHDLDPAADAAEVRGGSDEVDLNSKTWDDKARQAHVGLAPPAAATRSVS